MVRAPTGPAPRWEPLRPLTAEEAYLTAVLNVVQTKAKGCADTIPPCKAPGRGWGRSKARRARFPGRVISPGGDRLSQGSAARRLRAGRRTGRACRRVLSRFDDGV